MPKVIYWHFLAICWALMACTAFAEDEKSCKDLLHNLGNASIGLPFDQFDQQEGKSWRLLESSGCHTEAALLLETYIEIQESQLRIVKWHLAQVLATEGQVEQAVEKALQSLNPDDAQQNQGLNWNTYVLATVAFLRQDRAAFEVQYEALNAATQTRPENQANLRALGRLSSCFGKPYKDAYDCKLTSSPVVPTDAN